MFSHSAKCEASFKFAALIDFPYSRHSRRRSSPALADADAMSRPGCHFWCRLPQIWGALPVMIINLAICSACRVATLHCLLARGLLQIEHCLKAEGADICFARVHAPIEINIVEMLFLIDTHPDIRKLHERSSLRDKVSGNSIDCGQAHVSYCSLKRLKQVGFETFLGYLGSIKDAKYILCGSPHTCLRKNGSISLD